MMSPVLKPPIGTTAATLVPSIRSVPLPAKTTEPLAFPAGANSRRPPAITGLTARPPDCTSSTVAGADRSRRRSAVDDLQRGGLEHRAAGDAAGLYGLHAARGDQRSAYGAGNVLCPAVDYRGEIGAAGLHHLGAAGQHCRGEAGAAGQYELAAAAADDGIGGKPTRLDHLGIGGADDRAAGEAVDELQVVVVQHGAAGDATGFDHLDAAGQQKAVERGAGDVLEAAADHGVDIGAAERDRLAAAKADHRAAGDPARIQQ